ncbi:unnamed protein product [Staurois parvus]|uniref:Uncharacterized protein n=1 Tax=Staurois parvus TaxID=386267 RepID=A0ABN9E7L7_9NEOB|nr:unnamed protein product [Staurois parvus]
MLLPSPESLMGPCTGPIAAVSIATLCCHVPLSGLFTLLCVKFFDIGCWQITGLT